MTDGGIAGGGFVRDRIDEGRQVFVVAPRVSMTSTDDEAGEDVASVEAVFEDLCNGALADYRVELLHGRMHPDEKQSIMEAFSAGRIQVLVSTTVIEVGINIPNATVMTILGHSVSDSPSCTSSAAVLLGEVTRVMSVFLPMEMTRRRRMSVCKCSSRPMMDSSCPKLISA